MEKKYRVTCWITAESNREILKWKSELEYLKEISVPRYYGSDIDKTKTELHIFADAPSLWLSLLH